MFNIHIYRLDHGTKHKTHGKSSSSSSSSRKKPHRKSAVPIKFNHELLSHKSCGRFASVSPFYCCFCCYCCCTSFFPTFRQSHPIHHVFLTRRVPTFEQRECAASFGDLLEINMHTLLLVVVSCLLINPFFILHFSILFNRDPIN